MIPYSTEYVLRPYEILIYSRKSRQDDPRETVEEVLARHEKILQDYAERAFGGHIPEENIYREIVSGEKIDEREKMLEVLNRIESSEIKAVLVVEPERLSRGEALDVGRIIQHFRYTNTKVIVTDGRRFDLNIDYERQAFQDALLRGNYYLEYVKKILFRGRLSATSRGCYIQATPPYGYDKVKIGKDWTLTPNKDADVVKLIFDWYVKENMSIHAIIYRLEEMGYKPKDSEHWPYSSVRRILTNPHYTGKVRFNHRKETQVIKNGKMVKTEVISKDEDIVFVEGKHPAIIDQEIFDAAQKRFVKNPRVKKDKKLNNVLAGVLRCSGCGRIMEVKPGEKATWSDVYRCPRKSAPGVKRSQCFKSAKVDEVVGLVIRGLESAELPKLRAKLENGDGNAANIQKRRIDALSKQMESLRDQEVYQAELLQTRVYTPEMYMKMNARLREQMETCEKELYQARAAMPKNVDYGERIAKLEETIEALKNPDVSNEAKNRLLHEIVDRIDYSSTDEGRGKTAVHLDIKLRLDKD